MGSQRASGALASLWETVTALDTQITASASGSTAAEGQRFLLRMLAASLDTYVEQCDVDQPVLHHAESPTRKMFADCPDTDYLRAPIALGPGRVYRLWGRIPAGTLYAGFVLYGRGGRIGNRLTDRDLFLDDEGRFELRVSTEEQPGVWLRGDGDETAILVRQYFGDRSREEPIEVHIERVDAPQGTAALDDGELAARLGRAERMLKAVLGRTRQAHELATTLAVGRFVQIPGEQLFPTPDNTYCVAWFQIGAGDRMVVRGRLPRARYFGVALYNAWLESLDYQRHVVALNHEQLEVEADGSFELHLSAEPVDHPNWLDTTGHTEGYVLFRALLVEEPMPDYELVVVTGV